MKAQTNPGLVVVVSALGVLFSGGVVLLSLTANSLPTPLLIVLLTIGIAMAAGTIGAAVRLLRPVDGP